MLSPTIPPPTMTTSAASFMFSGNTPYDESGQIKQTAVCSVGLALLSMDKAPEPRLLADVMVGRLARWLRILGFDVLYSNRHEDDEIIRIATAENRIVLTRDRGLSARLKPDLLIFIHHDDVESQVEEVLQKIGRREFRVLSRCLEC